MKKTISLLILSVFLISAIGMASACTGTCEVTVIGGTVYQGDLIEGVEGANVEVICHHSGTDYTQTMTTVVDGTYLAQFPNWQCTYNDTVTVNAYKDDLTGSNDGLVNIELDNWFGCDLNIGVIHVPLVPEFGLVVGMATALSAVALFFVVRKK